MVLSYSKQEKKGKISRFGGWKRAIVSRKSGHFDADKGAFHSFHIAEHYS